MVRKNILKKGKVGHSVLYSPRNPKMKYLEKMFRDFVEYVVNGSLIPIFVNFVKKEKLKKEEIDQLKKVLDEIDEEE